MQYEIYLNNKMIPEDQSVIELENKPSYEEQIEVNIFNFYDLCTTHYLSPEIMITRINENMTITDGNTSIIVNLINKITTIRQNYDGNGVYYSLNIHLFTQTERDNNIGLFSHRSCKYISIDNIIQTMELYMYIKDKPPVYLHTYNANKFNDKIFSDLKRRVNAITSLKVGDYLFNDSEGFNLIKINDIKFLDDRFDKIPAFVVGMNIITKEIASYSLIMLISDDSYVDIPSDAYIYNAKEYKLYHNGKRIKLSHLTNYMYHLSNFSRSPYCTPANIVTMILHYINKCGEFIIPDELSEDSCIFVYDGYVFREVSMTHRHIYNFVKNNKGEGK